MVEEAVATNGAVIRPARPEEARAIADLWLESRRAAVPAIPPVAYSDDEVREHVAGEFVRGRPVWVAESAGRLVAMMVLDAGWVEQLYVRPGWTSQAIGSRLLGRAMADQRSLQLWAFVTNTGARRFYERHGFVAVEETDGSANVERAPDVRYEWRPTTG
jgi:GNAT superfamily N-acetyltransferase